MGKKKYTNTDKKRALKLYKAGMSGPDIEAITGIKKGTVQKWARRNGIVRPRSSIQLSKKEKEEIIYLYNQCHHSAKQISLIANIPEWSVFYFLKKNGLTRNKTQARRVRARKQLRKIHE